MAATTATTIYAYADRLCEDPRACRDGEQSTYAAVVAIASAIAHAVSILIAASLGLYMLGTAVGPLAVSVFQSYTASFTAALAIFSVTLVYLVTFVRVPALQAARLFPAIMVFASIHQRLGTFQNGLLVSTAAACAAVHLLLKVFIVPSLQRLRPNSDRFTDSTAVLGALVIQMLALAAITQIRTAGQLYLAVSVAAAGLSLPAFFKSYFVLFMPDASWAITALTFMKNLGGLASLFLLGSWQSVAPDPSVFAFAVALLGIQKHRWIGGNVSLVTESRAERHLDLVLIVCCVDIVLPGPVDDDDYTPFASANSTARATATGYSQ
ncbi:hypothetical protein CNMCM5793_000004 [Aspergillus hiratsukae]|uniref:Uncharacterized protein n=1 Tax=Aspergillus hiratsukae TaxID=1194566 RepID=A0A8H6P8W1_9EURO|nr:hypothetical protein CNMCM5793_000004 [Aspergillus hiratsukae]KAF7160846.1 hypothetical protein CNMCM6106_008207 [Aspergillus hiratsukae]